MPQLTGVRASISASHNDRLTGKPHGHSYKVIAWHNCQDRNDAVILQRNLEGICKAFDHTMLPPELERAEDLAAAILRLSPPSCVEVIIERPLEGLYARAILEEKPMTSRAFSGGLEPRFIVERSDGKPIEPSRRYALVLDFSGADPHALVAAKAYADSIRSVNAQVADDIEAALADPTKAPAQHRYT